MAQHASLMIPMQVLADIDNSRNPMQLTRERLERAATENQFMNGKIAAINVRIIRLMPLNIGATEDLFSSRTASTLTKPLRRISQNLRLI
jgi:hypothetical protein